MFGSFFAFLCFIIAVQAQLEYIKYRIPNQCQGPSMSPSPKLYLQRYSTLQNGKLKRIISLFRCSVLSLLANMCQWQLVSAAARWPLPLVANIWNDHRVSATPRYRVTPLYTFLPSDSSVTMVTFPPDTEAQNGFKDKSMVDLVNNVTMSYLASLLKSTTSMF